MNREAAKVLMAIGMLSGAVAHSAILTDTIDDWAESSTDMFGADAGSFTIFWSTASVFGGNGWFYGTDANSTYPEFYVYNGGIDVNTVRDASILSYQAATEWFDAGDTIFLRNSNGYYAALQVFDVYPNPSGEVFPYTFPNGHLTYHDDLSANFVVPAPASLWLLASALLAVAATRRHA